MRTFKYKKANGDVSTRTVHQLSIVEDKLLCVDLTEFDAEEREAYEAILDNIHKQYIQAIKDEGLGSTFRTFLIDGIH